MSYTLLILIKSHMFEHKFGVFCLFKIVDCQVMFYDIINKIKRYFLTIFE